MTENCKGNGATKQFKSVNNKYGKFIHDLGEDTVFEFHSISFKDLDSIAELLNRVDER